MPTTPFSASAVNEKIYVFRGYGEVQAYFPDVVVLDTSFRAVEASCKLPKH